jgi:hypothetical protein
LSKIRGLSSVVTRSLVVRIQIVEKAAVSKVSLMKDILREKAFGGDHEEAIKGCILKWVRGVLARIDDRIVERDYGGFGGLRVGKQGQTGGHSLDQIFEQSRREQRHG